jgi:hypothetical protein
MDYHHLVILESEKLLTKIEITKIEITNKYINIYRLAETLSIDRRRRHLYIKEYLIYAQ